MNIIAWIIVGGVAGWIASLIMKTNREQGCLIDIVVGVVGAFIGGIIIALIPGLGSPGFLNFSWTSLIVAIIGAVVLLAIVKAVRR